MGPEGEIRGSLTAKNMEEIKEGHSTVYEIGYLIVSSIPEEGVPAEADIVRKIINDAGSSIIAEEAPHRQSLAYTIRRKTVSGSYDKFDEAYFGWIKFEVESSKIEAIKKSVEITPSVLRMLLITTVSENTYLGKRAPLVSINPITEEKIPSRQPADGAVNVTDNAAPATIEEMDKSIDEMVKEV